MLSDKRHWFLGSIPVGLFCFLISIIDEVRSVCDVFFFFLTFRGVGTVVSGSPLVPEGGRFRGVGGLLLSYVLEKFMSVLYMVIFGIRPDTLLELFKSSQL